VRYDKDEEEEEEEEEEDGRKEGRNKASVRAMQRWELVADDLLAEGGNVEELEGRLLVLKHLK
jgi:hypothetical protein